MPPPRSSKPHGQNPGYFYKTKHCLAFSSPGGCPSGASCGYAHGPHELQIATVPSYKTKPCQRMVQDGSCIYGARCVFLHPEEFKKTPCARLATTGYCSYGSNCIFIHPEDCFVPVVLFRQNQASILGNISPSSSGQVTPQQPHSCFPDSVFGRVTPNPGRWSEASSTATSFFGFHEMPTASHRSSMTGSPEREFQILNSVILSVVEFVLRER
ncbi:hypothetical protein RvY_11364 [Ramazzottius varieornatus]|uniref:C3H1-type domain-containing protein n=1 Tax=Ramazzottius varieornatus TaxID=947166 RepID=A0A1D1VHY3_RAMVA|nr:hypothetical protein RvY_11364 [Ramazzottius varieornatus]